MYAKREACMTMLQNKQQLDIEIAKPILTCRIAEVRGRKTLRLGKRRSLLTTNNTMIDATGIQIHWALDIDVDKELEWTNNPIVTIPAGGKAALFYPFQLS